MVIRRGWIPASVPIAAFVSVVTAEAFLLLPAWDQWPGRVLANGIVLGLLVVFALILEYSQLRIVRRLDPLKARVKEVALPLRGPTLMLDNGLILVFSRTVVFITLLLGPNGSVVRPHFDEALRWTHARGTQRVAIIIPGAVVSPDSAELGALRTRLGVRLLVSMVREPRKQVDFASNPRWIVTLTAFRYFSVPNIERLAAELDAVESLLKRLVRPYMPSDVPTKPAQGLEAQPTSSRMGVEGAAPAGARPVDAGIWRRFRRTAPAFQQMVALILGLAAATVIGQLFSDGLTFILILIVLVAGGGRIGFSARTRRDGFAGGLIFGWAGWFLGLIIVGPLEAGLQGGGLLGIGLSLLAGFVVGLVYGFVMGLIGGAAGYLFARLARKPVHAQGP
jgi:hypothetical protein